MEFSRRLQELNKTLMISCLACHQMTKKTPTTTVGGSQEDWLPIHFTTTFKDDDLRHRQGVVILLPSGVTHTEDVNVAVESEGMILKVSVAIPPHITEPAEFLRF